MVERQAEGGGPLCSHAPDVAALRNVSDRHPLRRCPGRESVGDNEDANRDREEREEQLLHASPPLAAESATTPRTRHRGKPRTGVRSTTDASSARPRPAEPFFGKPRAAGKNAAPAHGRPQHIRAPQERVDGGGSVLAFEDEDDLALTEEDVVSLEPQVLDLEGRALLDELARRRGCAAPERNNDRNACPRHMLGPEPSEELVEFANQAGATQGGESGDEHALAGGPLEDERLVAVDPFTGSAPDLDGRELVQPNAKLLRFGGPLQDEFLVAQFEPAAGGRAVAGAPDDGVIPRMLADALAGHAAPFQSGSRTNSAGGFARRPQTRVARARESTHLTPRRLPGAARRWAIPPPLQEAPG